MRKATNQPLPVTIRLQSPPRYPPSDRNDVHTVYLKTVFLSISPYTIYQSIARTLVADERRPPTLWILCAVCAAVRNRTRRCRNWMKRSWFGDVTLALSRHGLSLTKPFIALLWTSPVCTCTEYKTYQYSYIHYY